eukprot:Lithocolla_globosa_v1_NODE_133_length_5886_cov_43.511748.p3 type:complete len:253 gc:universal NODE_133_length_5886_cov_43.511748:1224-1982(+)
MLFLFLSDEILVEILGYCSNSVRAGIISKTCRKFFELVLQSFFVPISLESLDLFPTLYPLALRCCQKPTRFGANVKQQLRNVKAAFGWLNQGTLVACPQLRVMMLSENFNQPVDALSTLTQLSQITFGRIFNQPVDVLSNLTQLSRITFGACFNQPVDALSNLTQLTEITFGSFFNQPVDALSNLTQLTQISFGYCFNQPVDALSNLTQLTQISFGCCFNQPVDALSNLTQLTASTRLWLQSHKFRYEDIYD